MINWCDTCRGTGKVRAGRFKREQCPACKGSRYHNPGPRPPAPPSPPPPPPSIQRIEVVIRKG